MKQSRMLGNHIKHLADIKELSFSDLSVILGCDESQVNSFIKGRTFFTFNQLNKLSEALGESVDSILNGDEAYYSSTVVHCMNGFDNPRNREFILDIIDDYVDIIDAVSIIK